MTLEAEIIEGSSLPHYTTGNPALIACAPEGDAGIPGSGLFADEDTPPTQARHEAQRSPDPAGEPLSVSESGVRRERGEAGEGGCPTAPQLPLANCP